MKKSVLVYSICGLLLAFATNGTTVAQSCNTELYITKAMQNLTTGFTFVKSYRIDGRKGRRPKIEYTCVFSKDTDYDIHIQSQAGGSSGIVATLYDSRRNQIATNYKSGRAYPNFRYTCRSTGIYYLTFTFSDSKDFCGGAVLGFKR